DPGSRAGPAASRMSPSGPELFSALAEGRFRRDTRWGAILHPGTVSLREARATDAVHVAVDGERLTVHVDRFSPLALTPGDGRRRYAPLRVAVHVMSLVGDAVGLLRGRHPERCELLCDVVEIDDDELEPDWLGNGCPDVGGGRPEPGCVPFNVADEAVHLLDSPTEAWSIHLEARFGGRLDDDRLRAAVGAALARHPMARARKLPWRWTDHQYEWQIEPVPDLDPLTVVDCPDERALDAVRAQLQSLSVPLAEAPPLRLRLVHGPDGDVLMLNANHAATDGYGALRLLRSVARAYTGADDPVPELDLFAARNLTAGLAAPDRATRVRRRLALAEKLRDLAAAPARVAPVGPADQPGYRFRLASLGAEETAALADLDHPGTVNDVLLAALNLAVHRWNAAQGAPCGRVSVLVPANLRPRAWRDEVVGNFTLLTRLSTTARQRASRRRALAALTTQTQRKKRTGMGTALVEVLGASPVLPLWAKSALSPLLRLTGNRLVDTAVCSNLGRLDEPLSFGPGAGEATAVHFTAPARMPCGVSIGAVTAGGRLHLAFRYRRAQFDDDAAARFTERYLAELAALVADVSRTGGG
ncbi:MAG TPA: hypothetical protein VG455_01510, partial [Acidimicrobiales bacterium]|nr:hypothetical protein [Acidimicrobiales bacterium]